MMPPKLILCPVDFSEHSRDAVKVAVDMAVCFGAELLLVHIVPAIQDLPMDVSVFKEGEYDASLHDAAVKRLTDLATAVAAGQKNLKVRSEVGTANDTAMELVRIAEKDQADMIIIATHGMTGWREIAFGSVAEKVVKQAACPVLVLRVKAAAAAEQSKAKDVSASSGAAR